MQITDKKLNKKAWARAISQPATEFAATQLPILAGKIPDGLRGTLYRNGPARLERNGIRVGHWFDGDGAILAVNFTDIETVGVYRYVQTTGYQEETAAGKLLYGNYGMTAPGIIWNQWIKPVKNAANTSVLALPDKLLALWEGGKPHALDLQTLETCSEDDLGYLTKGLSYSAHCKQDGNTGEIFNFGVTPALNAILNIYKSDSTGKIIKTATHQLKGVPIIHDFVLAGQYLIFFISPVRLNLWPVLLGTSNYSDSLEWLPQLGTQIIVFDRESLSLVSQGETESWFQWHFANGYVDATGAVIVDIARYEDFQTNQYLREVATGETHTIAKSTFSQVQLNPLTGKVIKIEQLSDKHCEFPSVPQQNVGQFSRYTYMSGFQPGTDIAKEIINTIACFDHQTGTLTEANIGENRYPSEPIYVQDSQKSEQGWLLTVVYDGNTHSSEVWVFASDALNQEPVCKLGLPSVIPHSFHGTWKPA
ncbi:carotenoid oxygenase family protein [Dolichospermum sp. ST_con]|nr:carotenoid oxygenase family protein [Dolichospermum sp. ST_con]MDD1421001.1 carotenoid oxygenase family protein [Dolichospermum sp. ST_sed1]MDD1426104.1 carotenoid oxygenase family protein [Dolichospermum sp. ST_sed9]MDD1432600.1 carotenoid oxygenase family protein [Dolichospermum sp. ST_sed6]MDD1441957.1 carotenoid oxygenase family protein [Dolichospermum sp. ST_sed3]MDD1447705.1 carotenoid oxygenase family protein [Dolichospermum sp. ST_sed8]MDD1453578.1 carotenoid oxygenase family prote